MGSLMQLGVLEQAAKVKSGEIAASELLEAAIEEIEVKNPVVNAVVIKCYEQARESLQSLTDHQPFAGVPFLLKDMVAEMAGTPLTEGSAFLKGYVSEQDSEFVARLKRAGFLILGKTNTPEYASKPTTEPLLYGPSKNPWDLSRSTGGSSGGAAAAVASGMVAVAHANDGGGSIRVPAAACGLVGLKPTRARNPLGPHYGDIGAGLICEHVVTRSVADNAALLDVLAGPLAGEPYGLPAATASYVDEVSREPGRMRIAFSDSALIETHVDPQCVAGVHEIATLLENQGHDIVEAKPNVEATNFSEFFTTIWICTMAWAIRDWERRTGRTPQKEHFEPHTWRMFCLDEQKRPSDFLMAVQDMHKFSLQVGPFFETYDAWLTPTLPIPAPPLGYFDYDKAHPKQATQRLEQFPSFTSIANVTGNPAITLPLCCADDGLPIGMQLTAGNGKEALLLQLAGQLERAKPWAARWPELT
ncbi:MAG: amidase [Pseudomonadota bacterium]